MAGRKPPILEPKPAVIEFQGPYLYEGLDLWRQALRREYNRQVAAPGVPDKWVRLAQAKRDEAERTRYFNDFYSDLPSPVRRVWEWESHRRWPRPSAREPASYLDVYANEDEIYYTRKAGRWSMGETQIRDMYNVDFQSLDQGTQDRFRDKALKITDARGVVPPWRVFKPARDVASNGLRQDPHVLAEDRKSMGLKVKALLRNGGEWVVASAFGGGGTFGEAIVWRVRDANGMTLAKIFLKRDKIENDEVSDKERRLLWDIHFSRNDHRYLPTLLGSYDTAPDSRGRTWLEYAIYGDLHHFLAYYVDNELVIPEPFAWYLLHCLAQALHFLEKGHNDRHKKGKHPTWIPKYHYDIKPGNILLDAPETDGPEWCRDYPKPILTDLGGAEDWPAMTDTDLIPNHVRGGGTPRFGPFELFPHIVQYWSNKERTAGPARPAPAQPPAGFPLAFPPSISRRAAPHKEPLPENTPVRTHTSVHQVGVVLWCLMASRTSPAGQLFAWRGARGGTAGPVARNPYPAWWDRLPAHQARRPWPWRVAKKGDREKYKAVVDRKWARGQRVVVKGGKKRVRTVPAGLDRLGMRAREWVAGGWEPYGPEEALKPAFSGRLVELVYRCMSPLPGDRPTPSQLWEETAKAMDDITAQYPDGSGRRPREVQLQPDKFPIGERVLRNHWEPNPGLFTVP